MKICVAGLWHLGTVTAACLASMGHRVVGFDTDEHVVRALKDGRPPLFEPGLPELVAQGIADETLSFTTSRTAAVGGAQAIWITHDTPVNDDDEADVESVFEQVVALFPYIESDAVVVISSQLVAGCTRRLQEMWNQGFPAKRVDFVYSPENLRLGHAIDVFKQPDRVIVGAEGSRARAVVSELLAPIQERIVWMSVESAEMTKHALNAFLAMSVSFANEVAAICEQVGADAKEVERGLKTEQRIGKGAYVGPGGAFAGGTLARDVQYLRLLANQHAQSAVLLTAIKESNDLHKGWVQRKLEQLLGPLRGRRICVLGLTYKPGTDTLRRSSSVELCRWLVSQGASVSAHDPRVKSLASESLGQIDIASSVVDALRDANAAVIATPWPDYKTLTANTFGSEMSRPVVVDANRFLAAALAVPGIEYHAVGTPARLKT